MNALLSILLIVLAQAQTGTVTGQIRLLDGAPASGIRVSAMADAGTLVSLAQTDNAGRFRIENIPPGRYYIQAGLIDFPTYYPGVSSLESATTISIADGGLVEKLNFTMTRSANGVTVRGRVPLVAGTAITRITMTGGNSLGLLGDTALVGATGSFEFHRVMPGSYTLRAPLASSGLPNLEIAVGDRDVEVGLPSAPGVKVSGNVGLGPRSPWHTAQRVALVGASPWARLETSVAEGGKFEFSDVPPGTFALRTVPGSGATPTATVADRDITNIVLPAYVELTGRTVTEDGAALPHFSSAIMVEARPARGTTLTTAVRPDGAFRIPMVEGEYRISVRDVPPGLAVKSLSYGSTDLLMAPLQLDGMSELREIRLTLGKGN